MANKGKRMVSEDLIKQIGQGGTEYTAGENITIEDGVISATDTAYNPGTGISISDQDVISVDTTTIATNAYAQTAAESAVRNGAITVDKNHYFIELPGDYSGDMDAWFADIPVLQTNGFTDAETFGHPVITGDQNAQGFEYLDLAGTFIIRDTANNINQLITTYSNNYFTAEDTAQQKASNLRHYLCFRSGNNDWSCPWTRYVGAVEFRYLVEDVPTVYATAIKISRSIYFGQTAFNANGVAGQSVDLRLGKLKANYNAAVATPTTEGDYMLKVGVDNNGEVDEVSWIATPTIPSYSLNKTTETLTFTYSDNTTGTLTVLTDVTLVQS